MSVIEVEVIEPAKIEDPFLVETDTTKVLDWMIDQVLNDHWCRNTLGIMKNQSCALGLITKAYHPGDR